MIAKGREIYIVDRVSLSAKGTLTVPFDISSGTVTAQSSGTIMVMYEGGSTKPLYMGTGDFVSWKGLRIKGIFALSTITLTLACSESDEKEVPMLTYGRAITTIQTVDVLGNLVNPSITPSDYDVKTLDLSTANTDYALNLSGVGLTIISSGQLSFKFNNTSKPSIPFNGSQAVIVSYDMIFTNVYVTNSAQSGVSATFIAWKR